MALRRGKEASQIVFSGQVRHVSLNINIVFIDQTEWIFQWPNTPWSPLNFCGHSLSGSTISILGFGRIGQRALSLLLPFGISRALYATSKLGQKSTTDYYNLLDGKNAQRVPVEPAKDINHLAEEADILIVLASYTENTHHIINEDLLKRMKRTAVIVNTARGSVFDIWISACILTRS
jgi:glyoxylate/hydroxypyruvate reductase